MGYIGYTGNNTALVETEPGFMMYVDTTNTGITPHLYRRGRWEPHVTRFFMNQNLKGSVCVDAGANMGYYSMLFGYKKAKKVFAFEPIKPLCHLCKKSASFNGKDSGSTDFQFVQKALSDKNETVSFEIKEDMGGSRVIEKGNTTVETKTLDSYNIPQVDYFKIDVEGHEEEVLKGAKETIKRNPQIKIVQECNPKYVNPNSMLKLWDELGLKAEIIGPNIIKPFKKEHLENFEDVLLTKK